MKLNWGTSIAIFYSLFMAIMIFMVIRATQDKVQLVQENYYDKDLNYEAFRVSRANAEALVEKINFEVFAEDRLLISFPNEKTDVEGTVTLYRPADRNLDQKFTLDLDQENNMAIGTTSLTKGLWRVRLDWNMHGKSYYQEEIITL